MKKKIRIAIDGRPLSGKKRGINQYVTNLLYQLNLLKDIEILIFTNGEILKAKFNKYKNLKFIATIPVIYPLWEMIIFPLYAWFHNSNVIHFTANTGSVFIAKLFKIKIIVTIHDIYFMKNPNHFPQAVNFRQKIGSFYRKTVVPNLIFHSDKIITVSNFSKKEIIDEFRIRAEKINVINNVLDEKFLKLISNKKKLKKENILFIVGGDHPQKNILNTINQLEKHCAKLLKEWKIVVCGLGGLKDKIKSKNLNLILKKHLPESELFKIYKKSRILLFPSIHESFGIPLIEALATKNEVIAMNAGASKEILNGYGKLYNFMDAEDLKIKLSNIINNKANKISQKKLEVYLKSFDNDLKKDSLFDVYYNK